MLGVAYYEIDETSFPYMEMQREKYSYLVRYFELVSMKIMELKMDQWVYFYEGAKVRW